MTVKVYNQEGQAVGEVELKPEVFGVEPNEAVVHQYVVNYLARQRQGTARTKTRKEVRGGGRKPWRQKGTGRARAGTIRSPLWRGGGTVFGPKPRLYGSRLPRQMKRLAMKSIFSDKAASARIMVLEDFQLEKPRTKAVVGLLKKLEIGDKKCLFLVEGRNENLMMSCRNIQEVRYGRAATTNGYELLNADYVVMTKAGLEKVQEVFA